MNVYVKNALIGAAVGAIAGAGASIFLTGDTNSNMPMALSLSTPAFEHNGFIPSEFTCDGDRSRHPEMVISGIPAGTMSMALLVDDPDIPQVFKEQRNIDAFDHWVLFNIPPVVTRIASGDPVGTPGANSAGSKTYTGPCPPTEYEPTEHRYIFTLYALDNELALEEGATKQEVLDALQGHVIEEAQLIGRYDRAQ